MNKLPNNTEREGTVYWYFVEATGIFLTAACFFIGFLKIVLQGIDSFCNITFGYYPPPKKREPVRISHLVLVCSLLKT